MKKVDYLSHLGSREYFVDRIGGIEIWRRKKGVKRDGRERWGE